MKNKKNSKFYAEFTGFINILSPQTEIKFNRELYDTNNEYEPNTGIFTPKKTGFYHIDINTEIVSASGLVYVVTLNFQENSSPIKELTINATEPADFATTLNMSFDYFLQKNNSYNVVISTPNNLGLNIGASFNAHRFT